MSTTAASDGALFEPRYARSASGLLREFNLAGVLSAADVHVARRLGAIAVERNEGGVLAGALAVRAPRGGATGSSIGRSGARQPPSTPTSRSISLRCRGRTPIRGSRASPARP